MKKSDEINNFRYILEEYQDKGYTIQDLSSLCAILLKGERIIYVYSVENSDGVVMHFDLFSHIATAYQPTFSRMLKRNGITISQKETETDYFDVYTM